MNTAMTTTGRIKTRFTFNPPGRDKDKDKDKQKKERK